MEILGLAFAITGAALAAGLSGAGSIGVGLAAQAAAGVTSEGLEKFGKMLQLKGLKSLAKQ